MQSPCPTGWRCESKDTIRVARYGVTSGIFPVLEVVDGRSWRVTVEPTFEGIDEYFKLQRRFGTVDEDAKRRIRQDLDRTWATIRARCAMETDRPVA